ncbi:hypothetical protein ColLi_10287 [Colletotrichum liriopes]|uniref:Uncharacterized protein n=1 Tax=Colletotrichum liriopes TaxID=708192 RepID=A0AA37GUD4_9PEZI|nr:hypothetical protein ColLi_10287 [Colletotrichum liriopes]
MKFSAQIALFIALSSVSTVVANPDQKLEDPASAATIQAAVEEAEAHAVAINETATIDPNVKAPQ